MYSKKLYNIIFFLSCFLLSSVSVASFIETTIGTAVVNDATAAYFNPAALMLLKNSQIIPLATVARFETRFSGQAQNVATGFTEFGSSRSTSYYYSPSFYLGIPIHERVTLGFAAVSNFAERNPEEGSVLRYVQSNNTIQDYDFVPSIGIRINRYFSVGGGVNFSQTNFNLHPITGFPGSNIPDSQSNNQSSGSGVGANAGFLLQPTPVTFIGFNYRTVTMYPESGKSTFNGLVSVTSNHYRFQLRTPTRYILSLSHLLTPKWGFITTIQRIQFSIIRNININSIATAIGTKPAIINASVPFYLHNAWILTLGGNYRFNPNWVIRVAGSFLQSPDNGHYQISTGNSYILGASLGYKINKILALDGGYAHAFMQNQKININGNRFLVNGNNQGSRDVVSLKLTINV